jgi:hypothetical protein
MTSPNGFSQAYEWMVQSLAQGAVSAILLSLVLYLLRNLVYERLRGAISYEYSRRLEGFRAENQKVLDLLKDARSERQAFRSMALGLMATTYSAASERRLDAIQSLWESIENTDSDLPPLIALFDIVGWRPDKIPPDKLRELLNFDWRTKLLQQGEFIRAVSAKRPFLDVGIFSLFKAYHSIVGQAISSTYVNLERGSNDFCPWFEQEETSELVRSVLSIHEYESFKKREHRKLSWLLKMVKLKLVDDIQRDLTGTHETSRLIEQASRILDLADEVNRTGPDESACAQDFVDSLL